MRERTGKRFRPPKDHGLYEARREHDSCGVGAVVNLSGRRSHQILESARQVIEHLHHRGAAGSDDITGDGGGVLYKGMFMAHQLFAYYPDLYDERMRTALAIVHQRYSTNTFPNWRLAQPFRLIAHNGEINTLSGNAHRMRARESQMANDRFGADIETLFPVLAEGMSDSACFDNALELLVRGGRSLPHALMMMIPEAFGSAYHISTDKRAFYEYHAAIMEPWDGPAAMVFTDGTLVGGTLDRNGLRPARYVVTTDGRVVLGSEVGVIEFPPEQIRTKGRLQPGKMFLVDTSEGASSTITKSRARSPAKSPIAVDWSGIASSCEACSPRPNRRPTNRNACCADCGRSGIRAKN